MHYGRLSATLKSAPVGGAITAVILLADGGDEIDVELLGGEQKGRAHEPLTAICLFVCLFVDVRWLIGDPNHVQSNYFYGHNILYTVNGGYHEISGPAVFDDYHTYSIDWLGLCCNSRKYAHLCLI